jgi:hypothetical protein
MAGTVLMSRADRLPFDVRLTYDDGKTSNLRVYAINIREALKNAAIWLPYHKPVAVIAIAKAIKHGK